jgi:hypothetical protein
MAVQGAFHEGTHSKAPIRELGLRIAGTPLAPLLAAFDREIAAAGLRQLHPRYCLSPAWGAPLEAIAIAIPFYLAHPELVGPDADRSGLVEAGDPADVLRCLRHELGHVVNYAYRLYDRPDWIATFGAITQPYGDAHQPPPGSTRFVHHLPGGCAQQHPDEDWAETFAVWMTPDCDWRADYGAWPGALAKLDLCDRVVRAIADTPQLVSDDVAEHDHEVAGPDDCTGELELIDEPPPMPPGLDGALRAIAGLAAGPGCRPLAALLRRHARAFARSVFTWTGHEADHTRALVHHLACRADALGLTIADPDEPATVIAMTALVTSLAMGHVERGSYLP